MAVWEPFVRLSPLTLPSPHSTAQTSDEWGEGSRSFVIWLNSL